MRYLNEKAFTLVEILIVLAILAVLGGLVFAAVNNAKDRGLMAQSTNNIRLITTANLAYAADNGEYVPAADRWNNRRWCGARPSRKESYDASEGFLSPYLGRSRSVTPCPLFRDMLTGGDSFESGAGGYGYNSQYVGGRPGGGYDEDGILISATIGQISNPDSVVMFATTALARSSGVQEYPFAEPPFWDFGYGPTSSRPTPSVHFRFNGKAIVSWCDGHISVEEPNDSAGGFNPYGGDPKEHNLGWFGPDEGNGYWNPQSPIANGIQ